MEQFEDKLTGDARKELASELLDVSTWEWHKGIALEEVKDALAQEVGDDANVVAEVKRVSQVDTLVAVVLVVACQSRQDPQLDATSIAVFLHRPDDLDGHVGVPPAVVCLYYLAERALAEELHDRVCRETVSATQGVSWQRRLTSLCQVSVVMDNVMPVVVVNFLVALGRSLYPYQQIEHPTRIRAKLTSGTNGTKTSLALSGGLGGGTYSVTGSGRASTSRFF
jgi:hypothetical protein